MRSCHLAALLFTVAAGGCLSSPRNQQALTGKAAPVTFEGFNPDSPAATVSVYAYNNATAQWVLVPHAPIPVDPTPHADNQGTTWYKYKATDVVLPQDNAYWKQSGPNNLQIKVKARSTNYGDQATFEIDADACMNQYLPIGGLAIRQNCASSQSPSATLNLHCGGDGDSCCLNAPTCNFGKSCGGGLCSVACGAVGQACCPASPYCASGGLCSGGTCVACGGPGQSCCPNNICTGGVCLGGTCQPRPDLVPTAFSITDLGGGVVQFNATVRNQGTAAVPALVELVRWQLEGGTQGCYSSVSMYAGAPLAAGAQVVVTGAASGGWTKALMNSCGGQWRVEVDSLQAASEAVESNNLAYFPNN